MSATRVVFGGPPVSSPMTQRELTMRLCLSPPPPLCRFLSSYEELRSAGVPSLKPLRPCLIPKAGSQQPGEWMEPHSGIGGDGTSTKKKRVVFADSKGLSLTAVRFFSEREGGCLDLHLEQQIGQARRRGWAQSPGFQERPGRRFSLGFPQPSADYLAFRDQLQRNLVRLENCSVNERSLSGTVRVKNVGFHKEVRVRITFDSWRSHRDLPCSYMHQTYGEADSDSFAFDIPLPEHPDPRERVEFCVSFCSGPHTAWDNNKGMNFRVFCTGDEQPAAPSLPPPPPPPPPPPRLPCKPLDKLSELEPLSSPRAAAELFFSRFQSWGRLEKVAPYW